MRWLCFDRLFDMIYYTRSEAGDGPVVSHVTIEVKVAGSDPRHYFLHIDRPKARERELAKFDEHR